MGEDEFETFEASLQNYHEEQANQRNRRGKLQKWLSDLFEEGSGAAAAEELLPEPDGSQSEPAAAIEVADDGSEFEPEEDEESDTEDDEGLDSEQREVMSEAELAHARQEEEAKDTLALNSGGDAAQDLLDDIVDEEAGAGDAAEAAETAGAVSKAAAQPVRQSGGLVSYIPSMHKACKTLVKPNGSPLKNIYAKIFAPANAGPGSCCQALFDGDTAPADITDITVAEFQALEGDLWTNSQHGFFERKTRRTTPT